MGEREPVQAGANGDHTIRVTHSSLPSFDETTKAALAFLGKELTPHGAPLGNTIHERAFRAFHLAFFTLTRSAGGAVRVAGRRTSVS